MKKRTTTIRPLVLADAMLFREAEIRQAVEETRAEGSFLRCGTMAGERKAGRRSDKTAFLAIGSTEELPFVVLDDGERIRRPESWLAVIDEVRERALQSPEVVQEWEIRYTQGIVFSFERMTGRLDRLQAPDAAILWIVENVEEAAVRRGLMCEDDCSLLPHSRRRAYR